MQNKLFPGILLAVLILITASCNNSQEGEKTTDTESTETENTPQPDEPAQWYYGVDVSHWNGDFIEDIDKLDSLTFAICKATQGVSYIDPDFHSNWQGIKQKGLIRGAYHFYLADDDPIAQAEHYYHSIGKIDDSLQMTYIVDIESGSISTKKSKQTVQQSLITFLNHIESLTSEIPMIYTSYNFANEYLADTMFSKYPLWLAEYSKSKTPLIPETWKEKGYTIWQKSESHDINSQLVDYDVFYGDLSDLY